MNEKEYLDMLVRLERDYVAYELGLIRDIGWLQRRYEMLQADQWYKERFPVEWQAAYEFLSLRVVLADRHLLFVRATLQRLRYHIADVFQSDEAYLILVYGDRLTHLFLGNPFYNPDQDKN